MIQLFMKIIKHKIKLLKNRKCIKDHKGNHVVVKKDRLFNKIVKISVLTVFSNKIKCVHVAQ